MSRGTNIKITQGENAFINSLLIKLASMPAGEDVAPVLMKDIKEYTNASMAMLNVYDPIGKTLKVSHVEANYGLINISKKVLGEKIFSTEMLVTDDLYKFVLENYVKKYEKLSGITNGATPAILDKAVKNILGICCFYGISHVFNNKLFGTTLLAFHKEQPEPSPKFLEAFGHLAAVTLRRNRAEKKLNQLMVDNQKMIQQLEQLNYSKIEEREKDRDFCSNILREETGQTLSKLKMDTGWLLENLDNKDACAQRLKGMNAVMENAIELIYNVSSDIYPSMLYDLGISSAIKWLAAKYQKQSELNIRLLIDVKELEKRKELACFRIVEQALANINMHAKASNVTISLKQTKNQIMLTITDDGIGISTDKLRSNESRGLIGMRERATMLGGKLSISSDNGTVVCATFPLD